MLLYVTCICYHVLSDKMSRRAMSWHIAPYHGASHAFTVPSRSVLFVLHGSVASAPCNLHAADVMRHDTFSQSSDITLPAGITDFN